MPSGKSKKMKSVWN